MLSNTINFLQPVKLCSAKNCYNTSENSPSLRFFPFPKQTTYARIWATNASRDDLVSKPSCVFSKQFLCSDHFLDKYFDKNYPKNTVLRKDINPIPTIFNIKVEIDIKVEPNDKQISQNKVNAIEQNTIPFFLPQELCLRPSTEWGKMNYTDDVYEHFLSNPNILNKPDDSDRLILRDYCRLCSKQLPLATLIPLFGGTRFLNYGDMLEYILPGEFKEEDSYPKQICSMCCTKLESAYITVKSFQNSNKFLKKFFDKEAEKIPDENVPVVEGISDLMSIPERRSLITIDVEKEEKRRKSLTTATAQPNEERRTLITVNAASNEERTLTNKVLNKVFDYEKIPDENVPVVEGISELMSIQERKSLIAIDVKKKEEKRRKSLTTTIAEPNEEKTLTTVHVELNEERSLTTDNAEPNEERSLTTVKAIPNEERSSKEEETSLTVNAESAVSNEEKSNEEQSNDENGMKNIPTLQTLEERHINLTQTGTQNYKLIVQNEEEIQIKHQCLTCLKLFNNETEIRNHSTLQHSEPNNCKFRIVKVKLCKKKEKRPPPDLSNEVEEIRANTPETSDSEDVKEKSNTFYFVKKRQCLKCYKLYRNEKMFICHTKQMHPELDKPISKLIKVKVKGSGLSTTPSFVSTTRYECLKCHTQHKTKDSFLKHSRLYHPETSTEKVVGRILKSRKYRNHAITCVRCSATFDTVRQYRAHMTKHAIYKCEPCGIIFDKFYKLRSHKKTHMKTLQCFACNKMFKSEKELTKHEDKKHKGGNVNCNICKESFQTRYELRKHKRVHDTALCNICGKLFPSENYLKHHILIHSDNRPFKCTVCPKTFKTSACLSKHKECHEQTRKYVCQFCGKLFRTTGTMAQHLLVHKKAKNHGCEICGVKFARRGNMIKHMERHNIINKIYRCQICDKQYNDYQHLIFHSCTSSTQRLRCTFCEKTFISVYQLKLHRRIHTGERPFPCDKCSKCFSTKQGLIKHKCLSLSDYIHQCDQCDKKFRKIQTLKKHKRNHKKTVEGLLQQFSEESKC